jgi:hypothetical protein
MTSKSAPDPLVKSWYASSEVPNVVTLTLQPVSFSKGVTQSTVGSVEPFSA